MEIQSVSDGVCVFNGARFKRDKWGYYSGTVNHTRKSLHRYVWEYHNGPIPKGFHVHHINADKDNNDIGNLELMKQSDHCRLHGRTKKPRIDNVPIQERIKEWEEKRKWLEEAKAEEEEERNRVGAKTEKQLMIHLLLFAFSRMKEFEEFCDMDLSNISLGGER